MHNLIQDLLRIQCKLSQRIIKHDCFGKVEGVVGVDVSFSKKNRAIAAAVLIDFDTLKILEKKTFLVELLFPYIPGFLGFREADAMVSVLNKLEEDFDVAMVNGHGILHPRGFGLASHVGLLVDAPTIGVAKRLIVGSSIEENTNTIKPVKFMGEIMGACVGEIYISIGHKISLKTAIELALKTSIHKIPEPLRQAHILATDTAKQELK